MTPKMRRDFESAWPDLSRRVERLLARKRIPISQRDDVLQETALRLIKMWDRVEPNLLPSLTTTITLNLIRDESRRRKTQGILAEIPELAEPGDVEAAGLARIELEKVRTAMNQLSPAQQSALLREIGDGAVAFSGTPDAEKMLRLRARRKLQAAIQKVSGLFLLRVRKIAEIFQAIGNGREAWVQGLSCVGCVAIGLMIAVPGGSLVRTAKADTLGPSVERKSAVTTLGVSAPVKRAVDSGATMARARNIERVDMVKNRPEAPASGDGEPTGTTGPGGTGGSKRPPPGSDNPLPIDPPDAQINPDDVPVPIDDAPDVPDIPAPDLPAPAPIDPLDTVKDTVEDLKVPGV